MSASIEFKNINPELYRHPGEREALAGLGKIPGFDKALGLLAEGAEGKSDRQAEVSSMVRVGPGVYPELDELWRDTLGRFGLGDIPLHVAYRAPEPWSIRGGNERPLVILSAELLDDLPRECMAALLAQRAGDIRLGNAAKLAASDFLRRLADFSGLAGVPAAMPAWGLESWRRQAAFSADRAAALALGTPAPVVALLEFAAGGGSRAWGGVSDPERLRLQGIEAASLDRSWSQSRWNRFTLAMNRRNHDALVRRLDLLDWFTTGDPDRILKGELPRPHEKAAFASAGAASGSSETDSAAYWGQFAPPGSHPGESSASFHCPAAELMGLSACPMSELSGMAGKGFDAFKKAGEAFMKTLREKTWPDGK